MGRVGRARVNNMKSRVFVIEDHPLMRRSLVDAIERETDLMVCGQAEDALRDEERQRPYERDGKGE
jgi:DNA-binding NarL/FixJ family response regulator